MRRPILAALALLAVSAAPAPDPLAQRLITEARQVNELSFGFERTTEVENAEGRVRRVDRFEPRSSPRWRLVSVDGRAPTPEELGEYAEFAKNARAPNYGRIGEMLASGATRPAPDRFLVERLPRHLVDGPAAEFADRFRVELTLGGPASAPFVEQSRVFTPEPFRAKLVARIDRFEAVSRYAPGPDGRPRIRSQTMALEGSALGRSLNSRTRITYRDL